MIPSAKVRETKSFTVRTVHGDTMIVSQEMIKLWAHYRNAARAKQNSK